MTDSSDPYRPGVIVETRDDLATNTTTIDVTLTDLVVTSAHDRKAIEGMVSDLVRHAINPTTYDLPDPEEPLMTEPTRPAEASRHMAEYRAGVYDDDLPDTCTNCDRWPCACDDLHDRDVEGWGE